MQETGIQALGQEDSPGEGNGNPLQYSWLENSMDRGAWQATVHGVSKSRIQLSNSHIQCGSCGKNTGTQPPEEEENRSLLQHSGSLSDIQTFFHTFRQLL